ncbi:alpha/beta fold hydrolase [Lysobacter solisilvae (ex Woo and Kim 2020)]|uniref:Alpha/beta hydrolase n=1 Tax=Agrilutibacter terrestris TaxID=2865112 RepID=A0A7H0FX22_9GAMM|nr:alpha/beta hydrolase [Lysobacter terrestris]QNP40588.1 alpha/beta hydrolase [Lysobacter terrestris]
MKSTALHLSLTSFLVSAGCVYAGTPANSSEAQAAREHNAVTIVLVHGAFADSSSWNGVIDTLLQRNFKVIAASIPLRSLSIDAGSVEDLVRSVQGDVVLVGHSYGGQVITAAAAGNSSVKGLVYVDALAPDIGESAADIGERFPGGTLGPSLAPPVSIQGGGSDLYVQQDRWPAQFAADVAPQAARLMAVGQRPVTDAALKDRLQQAPAWKGTPSWFIYGSEDRNITPAALGFMAQRAHSRHTVVVPKGSHVVMVSHPREVAMLIEEAANACCMPEEGKTP